MDPVSCLYNFLSIGILCYFVIICFLIKKCCMNCGTNCASDDGNLCKCYQKIYEGELTPSNHVIVCDGNQRVPISYLLNQQDNEGEYVLGDDGILYRNEACRECCTGDDISRSSCNSHEDVFVIHATRAREQCAPCSPSALGLGEGSLRRTASGGLSMGAGLSTGGDPSIRGDPSMGGGPSICGGPSMHSDPSMHVDPSIHGDPSMGAKSLISEKSVKSVKSVHPQTPISSIKGSPPNLSVVSELQGVIIPDVEPSIPAKRSSHQAVAFQAEPSEHIFTVEGSAGSSQHSKDIAGSSGSCGSPISRGSPSSHGSRISCGSRTSRISCVSLEGRISCGSRTTKSGGGSPSNKSSLTQASVKMGGSHISAGTLGKAASAAGSKSPSVGTKGSKMGSGGNASGSPCLSLGKSCPSAGSIKRTSGSPSQASVKAAVQFSAADESQGPDVDATSSHITNMSAAASYTSSHKEIDDDLACDGSPNTSGIKKSPSPCTPLNSGAGAGAGGKGPCGTGSGRSVCAAREARKQKSGSCVSPCRGSKTAKKSKSSTFKGLPCGSPGVPCPSKGSKSRGASPSTARNKDYGRGASPASDRNKNVCSGPAGGGLSPCAVSKKDISYGQSPATTTYSKSETESTFSTGVISPESSPSTPNQKRGSCGCTSASGHPSKKPVEKSPSPILKNPDDSPSSPKEGIVSPRVSIKENLDIITPEGIKSAPTFGKDDCDPCPFQPAGETASICSNRRNQYLSDEYKDNMSNKRKADKLAADYKESADISRGNKSARFSSSSKSCTKCSKGGTKSWASSSSVTSKTDTSTPATTNVSTTKCSKCSSSKYSSDTRISSFSTSTKTKPSGTNSLCNPSCKTSKSAANSSYLNSPNTRSNYKTASVTTADIDDFRTISPDRSRCENLGAALAKSQCGKIRRALQEVTCEAIKDPSKDVICNIGNSSDPNAECSAIRQLTENAECPSLLEFIEVVDQMGGKQSSKQNSRQGCRKATPSSRTSVDTPNKRPQSAPGTSSTVDAAVIHEISTKVQSCLQHARAIAAKMGGGSSECRKTMRVQCKNTSASPKDQAQTVKVNSNMTLNTRGVTINEYNKIDKPFGRNPGIQVKMINKSGNIEQFKKPYKELLTADASGAINIRIRSPCKSTPGKLLCVSTAKNPCCSDSTTYNTSSTQPTSSSQKQKVTIQSTEDDTTEESDNNWTGGQPSSQEYSSQEDNARRQENDYNSRKENYYNSQQKGCADGGQESCAKRREEMDDAVVVYKRSSKQKSVETKERASSSKGECSPECVSCKRRTCPTSKHYKGRKKQGKYQVYNVTTSHFSQMARTLRSPYIKGMPVVDARMYEQYIHPERYRAGENYLRRRREMIQKIKGKCPWM